MKTIYILQEKINGTWREIEGFCDWTTESRYSESYADAIELLTHYIHQYDSDQKGEYRIEESEA